MHAVIWEKYLSTGQFINVSDVLISYFIIFHNWLPLKLLQAFTSLFILLNTKLDVFILSVGNQTVASGHWIL